MNVESTLMGTATRREVARALTVDVMRMLQENIANDQDVNVTRAAEEVGVARSTFYRWLKTPPAKIDVIQVASLADYLHEAYGHPNFAALWRDAEARIK